MSTQSVASLAGDAHPDSHAEIVDGLVARACAEMPVFAPATQARVGEAVTALGWSFYKPEHARELAEIAARDTALWALFGGRLPNRTGPVGDCCYIGSQSIIAATTRCRPTRSCVTRSSPAARVSRRMKCVSYRLPRGNFVHSSNHITRRF